MFLRQSEFLPDLYMGEVFFETRIPLLFLCFDSKDNKYICSCHQADNKKREWVLAPISECRIRELQSNIITIREVFEVDELYVVTLKGFPVEPIIHKVNREDLAEEILPTAGYFLDGSGVY